MFIEKEDLILERAFHYWAWWLHRWTAEWMLKIICNAAILLRQGRLLPYMFLLPILSLLPVAKWWGAEPITSLLIPAFLPFLFFSESTHSTINYQKGRWRQLVLITYSGLPSRLCSLKLWTSFVHFFSVQATSEIFSGRKNNNNNNNVSMIRPKKSSNLLSSHFAKPLLFKCIMVVVSNPRITLKAWLLWCELPFILQSSGRTWSISSLAWWGKLGFLLPLQHSISMQRSILVPA